MKSVIPIQVYTPSMADGFGRDIGYLRISVVDRCNLRCTYCRPNGDDFHSIEREKLLSYEEIVRVTRAAVQLGVSKIRLTGGEPLVRKGIVDLVSQIAALPGVRDLAMSTNGILLAKYAQSLRDAGLQRVNISLDSLNPETFESLTGGRLSEVLAGICAAQDAGLNPIRINAVLMRGINDHEVSELIAWSIREHVELRLIELMPMCEGLDWRQHYYSFSELLQQPNIQALLNEDLADREGSSAARYLPLRTGEGYVGLIEPMSNHFCTSCNRLRLMSDGKLRPCLSADNEIDLRTALRAGCDDHELLGLIRLATAKKQELSTYNFDDYGRQRSMIAIGG